MAKETSYGICPYQIMNGSIYILLNKTSSVSYFNFFKGKVENNETPEECAIREFKEETGVEVKEKDLEDFFFQKSKRKDVGIFLVDWSKYHNDTFRFQKQEIWSASWVEIGNIEISNNQAKIVNDIIIYFKPRINAIKNLYSSQ